MMMPDFAGHVRARPITRKTAQSALAQFMERLRALNANAEYLYRVESALLFGSMLTETERLGDVDIAVKCFRRPLAKSSTGGVTVVVTPRKRLGSASSPILTGRCGQERMSIGRFAGASAL